MQWHVISDASLHTSHTLNSDSFADDSHSRADYLNGNPSARLIVFACQQHGLLVAEAGCEQNGAGLKLKTHMYIAVSAFSATINGESCVEVVPDTGREIGTCCGGALIQYGRHQ